MCRMDGVGRCGAHKIAAGHVSGIIAKERQRPGLIGAGVCLLSDSVSRSLSCDGTLLAARTSSR